MPSYRTRRTVTSRRAQWAACACLLLTAVMPATVRATDEILWHETIADVTAAARQSGKPIYVYIYYQYLLTCRRMMGETLRDPAVVQLLNQFECCALDATSEQDREFIDRYARKLAADPETGTRWGQLSANVFLDATGQKQYVCWGYIPPAGFATVVEQVLRVIQLRATLARNPNDARALADLGHMLLALPRSEESLLQQATASLQAAVKADPNNQVGAKEDATLDLIVLAIPDDPAKGYEALVQFMRDYPQTKRALEVRYWQAVALYAQNTPQTNKAALELLQPFTTSDQTRPEFNSPWTRPALELESVIRAQVQGKELPVKRRRQ